MKLPAFLLALACTAASQAGEAVFDPFAPSTKTFAESLPPAPKPPGREVVVQLLEVREQGRVAPWPAEPPQEWLTDAKDGLLALKTRLNLDAETRRVAQFEKDPSGKPLAEAFAVGVDFACRPDETDDPGVYTLHFRYTRDTLTGWLEEPAGTYTPLRESRSLQTRIQLNNRWFLMGCGDGSVRVTNGIEEKTEASALYLRIDDGLPPAGRATVAQEPSSVAPAP